MLSNQFQRKNSETWQKKKKYYKTTGRPKRKKRSGLSLSWKKKLFSIILVLILVTTLGIFLFVAWLSRDLPQPDQLMNREIVQSTKIYDRTGKHILYEIHGDKKRTLVTLKDIPPYVKEATIAIEDKNFYKHTGFSIWAVFRTMITNIIYNRRAGGSTLTQQFIKNAVLTNEKKITRKIKEIVLAQRLEKKFTKDQILQMYLNEIPYGSNAYGVEAASQKYFNKSVKDVDLAEAAILAALPQAPSRYSPYGPNKDFLLGRKNYVLDLMAQQGYITTKQRDVAQAEKIKFSGQATNIIAPHFVMYIKNILAEKYGEKMVEQEGLKIYTTLDLYKQKIAEKVIAERTKNYEKNFHADNAALVAIDPKTGQILAMVGSRDYFDDKIDGQVNITTRPRQPGSSMKPIVYASLFEKGYTPNSILYDVKTNFSTDPNKPYSPRDYTGKEVGPVSIRKALAGSLNIPAVKALYLTSINDVIDLAEKLGYTTLHPRSRFGLSLVLGGAEVKLLEHTNAYSVFARDGYINPVVGILKIEDKNGKIIEQYKNTKKRVISSQVARMINSILSDNDARAFTFGKHNFLNLGDRPVGAKTGTTNDYHDAWTIGYTPSLVAGVWVGNTNNDKMVDKAGGSAVAAPIWHDFMKQVLGNTPIEQFKKPDDYKRKKPILNGEIPPELVKIDISSGLLATTSTPPELIEERMVPGYHSILYYVNRNDPLGPAPKEASTDPQFPAWEKGVADWVKENPELYLKLPKGYDQFHNIKNKPTLEIISPTENETISNSNLNVQIKTKAPRGINRVEYYLNNNLWGTSWGGATSFSKSIDFLNNGYNYLTVKSCDDIENCSKETTVFNLLLKNNPINTQRNSIKLLYPNHDSALNSIDFPLNVRLLIGIPKRTAKIDLIIENNKKSLVVRRIIPQQKNMEINWGSSPAPGVYIFYAKLYDWNGNVLKSNKVNLVIK